MALKKGKKSEVWIDLTVELLGDHNTVLLVPFSACFRLLPKKEFESVMEQAAAGEVTDHDIVNRYLLDWKMPGEGGDVEFNEENVNEAMEEYDYPEVLIRGFVDLHRQRKALKTKN